MGYTELTDTQSEYLSSRLSRYGYDYDAVYKASLLITVKQYKYILALSYSDSQELDSRVESILQINKINHVKERFNAGNTEFTSNQSND